MLKWQHLAGTLNKY